MAIMYPKDLENYNYTQTEKEMYLALKEQLSDRLQVFYSIRWFEKDENNKRIDSECDFLIFDPSFGFLTMEVKGGLGIEIEDGSWYLKEGYSNDFDSKRKLKCSPYEQSEKSMRYFHKYFTEEYNQTFNGAYGNVVAFPRYVLDKKIAHEAPLDITIDVNDMKNLAKKINEIFHYWKNKRNIRIPFSSDQRKRFINVVNKSISLSAAAGALLPIKEKEFSKIDFMQDNVIDILHHYEQVRIVGGAGTGKTYIAMKKVARDLKEEKKVLYLCCSKELSNFVNSKISEHKNFKCCTFHEIMFELLSEKIGYNCVNIKSEQNFFDKLSELDEIKKYDSIVVDEAQDFDVDMGLSVRLLLKNEEKSSLYVFYDKNQNVFEKEFENAFAVTTPPFVLRYNIRNTGSIYNCAIERTSLGKETIANNLIGIEPEERTYKNKSQTLKDLTQIVNRLTQKEYVKTQSIVVLSSEKIEDTVLNGETRIGKLEISFKDLSQISDNEICFKTVEEFKGLEADIVIYLETCDKDKIKNNLEKSKEYVALTRARYYLYILSTYNAN